VDQTFGTLFQKKKSEIDQAADSINAQCDFVLQGYQEQAIVALERMKKRGAFNTSVSRSQPVLERSFPISWNPCVIHQALTRRLKSSVTSSFNDPGVFQIVVLGGSASSRPGDNCQDGKKDRFSGRYSNILEEALQQNYNFSSYGNSTNITGIRFEVANMAQGSTETSTNALLMDELVNVNTTDLLLWEFLINEAVGTNLEKARKIDFWLTRVKARFDRFRRRPPPILFLFLWKVDVGTKSASYLAKNGIDIHPVEEFAGDVFQRYIQLGWDIQAINVGAAVDPTLLSRNVRAFFDDNHHPSCEGVHLIADLISHTINTNLARTDIVCPKSGSATPLIPDADNNNNNNNHSLNLSALAVPPHPTILGDVKPRWKPLWTDLFREDAIIGSWSPWLPNAGISDLAVGNQEQIQEFETFNLGKSSIRRKDRKPGYIVPQCGKRPITFVLEEPHLTWIGLGHDQDQSLKVKINNVTVNVPDDNGWNIAGKLYINRWIHLPTNDVPLADTYEVVVCRTVDDIVGLTQLVGVMVPSFRPVASTATENATDEKWS